MKTAQIVSCNIGNAIASCSSIQELRLANQNWHISGQLESRPHPDDILFSTHLGFGTLPASKGGGVIILQGLHDGTLVSLLGLEANHTSSIFDIKNMS